MDGAAVGQMNNLQTSKTFGEYYGIEIKEQVERIAHTDERVHIVFDVDRKASRKRKASERRRNNEEVRISIKKNSPLYRKFN